jgi:hypothetical protein
MDPFLDAIGVKDAAPPPAAPPAAKPQTSEWKPANPLDAAIRTVAAESSGDPAESKWIAGVIANRAKASKKSLLDVVQENDGKTYQFEPWATPAGRQKLASIDPNSDEYKKLAAVVQPVLEGKEPDPTGGAMNFYAPEAQAGLGRPKPEWDDGKGAQVGKTMFFGGKNTPPDPFLATIGADPAKADAAATEKVDLTGAGIVPFSKGVEGTLNKAQTETYNQFQKAGYLVLDDQAQAPEGSVLNPLWMHPGASVKDVPFGAYYVDTDGKLKRAPGGPKKDGHFLDAVGRGAGDVLQSVGELMPGTKDSEVLNVLQASQHAYDADYKGDLKMGMGRFTGQVVGSLPVTAGSEALLGLKGAGAAGQFLAGRAGGGLLARGASLATSGALEGAEASALTSSAGEGSKKDQIITGALLGGVLKPVAGAVETGIRRLIGTPKATEGAVSAAEQERRIRDAQAHPEAPAAGPGPQPANGAPTVDTSQGLPIRVPLTQGQITGAPAQQLAENAMLRGAEGDAAAGVMQHHVAEAQAALRGNVEAIASQLAGDKAVAVGDGGRAVSERLNASRDAVKATVDKAYDDARARGEDAMLSTAKDLREGILEGLRRKYNLDRVKSVAGEVEKLGEGGAPTVRELYDMRERLSSLTQSSDSVEGGAARVAKGAFDDYMRVALKNDLLVGDPTAVKAWKDAIRKRAAFGRLFQGNDLIEALTERTARGGEQQTLKVAPEDATNYIFNRSSLGFIGKKDLKRDLARMRTVLGPDSEAWNTLRGEAFKRIARSGEGSAEGGAPMFSGQKFMNAWTKAKADDPEVLATMFTAEERSLIDRFAEVAQRATTPVKGGDNPSNTAITMKKFTEQWFPFLTPSGGAAAGAVAGGPAGAAGGAVLGSFFNALREALKVNKAIKATRGATVIADQPSLKNKLLPDLVTPAGAIAGAHQIPPPVQ